LDECYRDTSYLLDDDDYAEAEELDIVRKRFQRAWEGLVDGYKVGLAVIQNTYRLELTSQGVLTDHNYQILFNLTVETLVRPWEKMVIGMEFTEVHPLNGHHSRAKLMLTLQLGAIRYDRDIRGIANYLSTQTNFGGVREKFTRLQQIGTVLNMDQVSRSTPKVREATS
jgi:hypothetical protein